MYCGTDGESIAIPHVPHRRVPQNFTRFPSVKRGHLVVDDKSERISDLINRVIRSDVDALAEIYAIFQPRLWRMVNFRLDRRLQGRVDADDVLQESWLKAVDRIDHFLKDASRSIFIWFRMIVSQTMIEIHRRHLGAEKRSAAKEISTRGGWSSSSTSFSLTHQLLGHLTSPSLAALRAELSTQLETALNSMSPIDREVLALRHFEELSNRETAQVLEMSEQAASARYVRAISRLRHVLEALPGFADVNSD
ncbi:MAG: sigma-70 family RNA polymerase sigma factor [Planctomycetota bacterium]|nr:sigma-70 family RNA polymerase sigma factor [Planctomycetota bacterium]